MEFLHCSSDFNSYGHQWRLHENVNWLFFSGLLILDKNLQNVVSSTLFRIAELVERENEAYHKLDPDPFDDRHPGNIYVAVNFCFSFVLNSLAYSTIPKTVEK